MQTTFIDIDTNEALDIQWHSNNVPARLEYISANGIWYKVDEVVYRIVEKLNFTPPEQILPVVYLKKTGRPYFI